jgi:hypothetical protein
MTYAGIPIVRQGVLLDQQRRIRLDTAAWFAWLETATHFSYVPEPVMAAITVRKEKRRHRYYWFAYVKRYAKLHNAYLGKSEALTRQKLAATAVRLNQRPYQAGDKP